MTRLATDLKIGLLALIITFVTAFVLFFIWYQNHQVSREFLFEAQKISAALPILGVTEGQLADWTREMRRGETVKGETEKHLLEQAEKIRKGEYTAAEFDKHLLNCRQFCGLLLSKIFAANALEIANLPHDIVFFELDKDLVTPRYQRELQEFADKNRNLPFHLVGRASYIGTPLYNKELSARRVKRVAELLKKSGISESRIRIFWLGYEDPQLTREMADLYGIDIQEYQGDLFNLNQSVVIFADTPDRTYPAAISAMQAEVKDRLNSSKVRNVKTTNPNQIGNQP